MSERLLRYEGVTEQQGLLAEIAASALAGLGDDPMAGADLGWFGIGFGEGSGSPEDLAVVVEAAGAATSSTLAGWQAGVVIPILAPGGADAEPHLLRLAAGDAVAALATCDPGKLARSLRRSDERLSGSFLAFGTEGSTHVLVPMHQAGEPDAVALVPSGAAGLRVEPLDAIDVTRPFVRVTLDEVAIGSADLVVTGPDTFDTWLARLNLVCALDASGAARRALERTLVYACQRQQFGRLIGSFQAYKHRCATMFIRLKVSQSLAFAAARAIEHADGPDLAFSAGRLATSTATFIAGEAVQLHGGIGFTWEAGLHRLLKRARIDEIVAHAEGANSRLLLASFRAGRQRSGPLAASPSADTLV